MRLTTNLGGLRPRTALLAALALAFSFTAQAATINVDSGTDDGTGCTLREAVQAANTDSPVGGCSAGDDANDTITFSVATVTLTAGSIEITEQLEVQGPVAITAAPASRIFMVSGAEAVDFVDVDLENAYGDGAAVMIAGSSAVSYTGGSVSNSVAPLVGGGIWVSDTASLVVDGTSFTGNRARGAASNQGGGAIYTDGGPVTVSNATFTDNRAIGTSGSGGGILNPNGATLTVTSSTFSTNRAQRAGGGIETVGGTTTVTGTDFTGNNAGANPGNGGAIHGGGAAVVNITDGIAQMNRANEGGAFWISGAGTMTIDGTNIRGNFANGPDAQQGGGGLYIDGGTATVTGATFFDNRAAGASGSGGAIFVYEGSLTVTGMTTFEQNRSNRAGGAIEITTGTAGGVSVVTITGSDFTFNQTGNAPGNGGGIHTTTGDITLNVTGGTFSRNIAESEGGGIWINPGTVATIDGTDFDANSARGAAADNGGGALFNNGGVFDVSGGLYSDNLAFGASGSGGAVLAVGGASTFSGSTFTGNAANRAGGAFEVTDGASVTIDSESLLEGNRTGSAPGNGGGLHVTGAGSVTIDGSTVRGNTAENQGGGLWNFNTGTMTVTNSTVNLNSAPTGGGIYQQGGAGGGTLVVSESLVNANTANQNGGGFALFSGATVTVENTTIYGNNARRGGGVYSDDTDTDFDSATIAENSASTAGGGLFNMDGNDRPVSLMNTIVADNSAPNQPNLAGRYASDGWNVISTSPPAATFPAMPSDQIGTDPMLEPLADNGGPTLTAALMAGSPAIDAGMTDLAVDQRGVARTEPDDVGAVEFGDATSGEADVLISEFEPNPDGTDPSDVSFEISGTPGEMFSGSILEIENDGINGTLDRRADVMGTFDSNGLLVVTIPDLENPSFTVVLATGTPASTTVGTDLDANDDGTIDDPSALGTVLDAVGVSDATGDDATLYASGLGGTDVLFNGNFEPAILFRDASTGDFYQVVAAFNEDPAVVYDASGTEVDASEFDSDPTMTTFGAINPSRDMDASRVAGPTAGLEAMTEPVALDVVPNPFGASARTTFAVKEAQRVSVTVFDVMGRQVQSLFDGPVEAESPVTVSVDGGALASGVYVVVVQGETVRTTKTVTVAR